MDSNSEVAKSKLACVVLADLNQNGVSGQSIPDPPVCSDSSVPNAHLLTWLQAEEVLDLANVTGRPRAESLLKWVGRDRFRIAVTKSMKDVVDTLV